MPHDSDKMLPGTVVPSLVDLRHHRRRRDPMLRPGHLLAIFIGGMAGAVLRYSLAELYPVVPGRFPAITFIENVSGAFLLGLMLPLILERWRPVRLAHPLFCTGLLGSFTTFSNFSLELVNLLEAGRAPLAAGYAAASILGGLLAALIGMNLARKWPPTWRRKDRA